MLSLKRIIFTLFTYSISISANAQNWDSSKQQKLNTEFDSFISELIYYRIGLMPNIENKDINISTDDFQESIENFANDLFAIDSNFTKALKNDTICNKYNLRWVSSSILFRMEEGKNQKLCDIPPFLQYNFNDSTSEPIGSNKYFYQGSYLIGTKYLILRYEETNSRTQMPDFKYLYFSTQEKSDLDRLKVFNEHLHKLQYARIDSSFQIKMEDEYDVLFQRSTTFFRSGNGKIIFSNLGNYRFTHPIDSTYNFPILTEKKMNEYFSTWEVQFKNLTATNIKMKQSTSEWSGLSSYIIEKPKMENSNGSLYTGNSFDDFTLISFNNSEYLILIQINSPMEYTAIPKSGGSFDVYYLKKK